MNAISTALQTVAIALTREQAEHLINQFKSGQLMSVDIVDVRYVGSTGDDELSVFFRDGASVTICIKGVEDTYERSGSTAARAIEDLWRACRLRLRAGPHASGAELANVDVKVKDAWLASRARGLPNLPAGVDIGDAASSDHGNLPLCVPLNTFQMQDPDELLFLLRELVTPHFVASLHTSDDPDGLETGETPARMAAQHEEVYRCVNEVLDALSEPHQTIARLKLRGFSNEEIARRVNISRHTVGRRLRILRSAWQQGVKI